MNRRHLAIGQLLLAASAACTATVDSLPPQEVGTDPTTSRLLPADYVDATDERPLEWRQDDYVRDVLETEVAALVLECELEAADPSGTTTRRDRATLDRAAFASQLEAARSLPVSGPESAVTLRPIDRFLLDFATERLRSSGYDFAALEAWRAGNRRFSSTRELADRDAAIAARAPALASLARAMPLRRLLADLAKGPLTPDARAQVLGALKIQYPDAALPAGGFVAEEPRNSASSPTVLAPAGSAKVLPAAAGAKTTGLPALDGAESAVKALPDLRSLLSGASAGAPQKN